MKGFLPSRPDFAYPKKVCASAEKQLAEGLRKGDDDKIVHALICYGLAETGIDADAFPQVVARIDSVSARVSSPGCRAMLRLLLADIFTDYYHRNSWRFDKRTSVEGETDFRLWSTDQIKARVGELCTEALAHPQALIDTRLKDYRQSVTAGAATLRYYPTLYDFACSKAIDNLMSLCTVPGMLGATALGNPPAAASLPAFLPAEYRQAWEIAAQWADTPRPGAAEAALNARLRRLSLVGDAVVDATQPMNEALLSIYRDTDPDIAGLALCYVNYRSMTPDQLADYYSLLGRYPRLGSFRSTVRSQRESIARQSVVLRYPGQVMKGVEFDIEVEASNINDLSVVIYRVTGDRSHRYSSRRFKASALEKVAEMPVSVEGTVPFTGKATVKATVDSYGEYVILSGHTPCEGYHDIVRCSDLSMASAASAGDYMFWTVDAVTGCPVDSAKVVATHGYKTATVVTGSDGLASFRLPEGSVEAYPELGDDLYAPSAGAACTGRYSARPAAWIRTSLPVYHPGDSLDFVLVAYNRDVPGRAAVLPGTTLTVTLFDANYDRVEDMEVVTDGFGRASGSFALPREGLTGHYRITAQGSTRDDDLSGSLSVMVSDYKLPTYEVVLEKPAVDAQGDVTVTGRAVAYSGFPVQNAEVDLVFTNGSGRWWWRSAGSTVTVARETAVTDAEGRFSVTLPSLRPTLPWPDGVVTVEATVTSGSKETHAASSSFVLSDGLSIEFSPGRYLHAVSDARLPVTVVDALGTPVEAQVTLEVSGGVHIVRRLDVKPGIPASVDLSALPSGPCTVRLTADRAEPLELTGVAVYNPADNACPDGTPLWVMQESVSLSPADRTASIRYASAVDDARVLMVLSSADKVLSSEWLSPRRGMNTWQVTLPDSVADARVQFYCTRLAQSYSHSVALKVINPDRELSLTVSRTRDRAVPGTPETLSLRVGNGNGDGVPAAVVLDVYCKALDAIASQSWHISPFLSLPSLAFSGHSWRRMSDLWRSDIGRTVLQIPAVPGFQLYDRYFGETVRRLRVVERNMPMECGAAVDSSPVMYSSMAEDTSVELAKMSMAPNDAEADALAPDEPQNVQYRPSEVALACFAPLLVTDADGSLTITFTLPDANTTWVTQALTFVKGMAASLDVGEIVASKPLMVQPNLPRFMRTGDRASIRVTVMNASGSDCRAGVRFEVLDGVSGRRLALADSALELAAGASAVAAFPLDAPLGCSALEVRVSASDGVYTDAERAVLPVLPSSQPVTDSDVFYMAVEQKDWCTDLAAPGDDAVTVVSFCENPTWEVVSALPGLMTGASQTALGESARIFSAVVARYVLSLNPAIETHLSGWLSATPAETRSSLARNPELRQMLLSATPWAGAEASDAERINRLWLIFDKENVDEGMAEAIANLRRLQTPLGGWLWCAGDEMPSLWMTFQVLNNFAELRNLGCFPEELAADCSKALAWIDLTVDEIRRDNPHYTNLHYAYVRSMFADIPNAYPAVYRNTVKEAAAEWDTYPLAGKAAAALLLHAEGNDSAARRILRSLREYARTSPQLGMWWPNLDESTWWALLRTGQTALILDAFHTVEPGCPEIDPIRQWLILSKTTTDWKTSVDAAACVASILRCGSDWLSRPGTAKVSVAGRPLPLSDVDALTGRVVVRLDHPQGSFCVSRTNEGPAWGAVMTTSTRAIDTVQAHSAGDQLSIEKQMLVSDASGAWHPWQPDTDPDIPAGAKVKVRLVLTAARDFDYLSIVDARAAGLETVLQTPRYQWADGVGFYIEPRDAATNIFVTRLPKGVYVLEYDTYANNAGTFASGIATAQSQYAPEYTAHSAGLPLRIR